MAYPGGSATFGTIFKMTPAGVVTVLHNFHDGSVPFDGYRPRSNLIVGSDGALYGTTTTGGPNNLCGTAFRITTDGSQYTMLGSFSSGSPTQANVPVAGLTLGLDGNFYGTSGGGGSADQGTVFRMTPQGQVTLIYSFTDPNDPNGHPVAPVVFGSDGNLYGTTTTALFVMSPKGTMLINHNLTYTVANEGSGICGQPMLMASDGNFYGMNNSGGTNFVSGFSLGYLYKMTPQGAVTILHSFGDPAVTNDGAQGGQSYAGLVQGPDGTIYGTTMKGGANGKGTVFAFGLDEPTITATSPGQVTQEAGGAATFSVSATGTGTLSYQWLYNGAAIPGATSSSYTVQPVLSGNTGSYTVIITDANGNSVQSLPFVLSLPPTDTPLLPPWGYPVLALLLMLSARRFLPRVSRA